MRVVIIVAAASCALVAASSAEARIVVQHGVAGASLHMTKAQVRARLGAPVRVRAGRNDFGRYTEFVYSNVTVSFQIGARATAFRVSTRAERTAGGIGVGSTEAAVKAGIAHITCRTESGFRHCFVGRFLPGRVVTDFRIRSGRVRSITIGYVLD
ncbi:MAG TPA: hypothetical protein VIU81_05710 [Gaiellaceae bacterium]